jgi:hypothetical protein
MKNIYVYIFIIGVILFIAGLWLSRRVEGFQSGTSRLILSGIDKDGNIYTADAGLTNSPNWSKISGTMKQISGSLGQFIGVNSSNAIFYGTQKPNMPFVWTKINDSIATNVQVSFDYPKVAAVIGSSIGYIDNVTSANPVFTMISPPVPFTPPIPFKWIDISVGSAYAIGVNNKIYYCPNITGSKWVWSDVTGSINGYTFEQVSYDSNSAVVLTNDNKLWSTMDVASPTWIELKGKAVKQMTLKDNNIFAIGTDNNIWYSPSQTNATWSKVSGSMVYVDSFYPITSDIISGRDAGNAYCDPGYKISGNKCASECPIGEVETEKQCFKNQTTRVISPPNTIADLTYTCDNVSHGVNFKPGAKCVSVVDGTESTTAPVEEVFGVKGSLTRLQAQAKCVSYGARLATIYEISDAADVGARWCSWGWTAENPSTNMSLAHICGSAPAPPGNINTLYGANCYGVKPTLSVSNDIQPFKVEGSTVIWNQVPQCDVGYVLKLNATCLSICPEGTLGNNTYCNYPLTDKASKAKITVNFTCPTGYDAPDVTACSSFTSDIINNCASGFEYDSSMGVCVEKCPSGFNRTGTTCTSQVTQVASTSSEICPANHAVNSENTCDQTCPPGYTKVGSNVCSTGEPTTSSPIQTCDDPEYSELIQTPQGARCRRPGVPGYGVAALKIPSFQCPAGTTYYKRPGYDTPICFTCPVISGTSGRIEVPSGMAAPVEKCTDIPLLKSKVAKVTSHTCPPSYRLDTDGVTCYQECPAGSSRSGATCTYNVPRNTAQKLGESPGQKCATASPTCYESCPDGFIRNGTTCTYGASVSTSTNAPPTVAARKTTPATFIRPCDTGYTLIGTSCYADCKAGDNDFAKQCQTPAAVRTIRPPTVSTPSTMICNPDSDFINKKCVKKCETGKLSTNTNCSDSATNRIITSLKYTSPCNSNEEFINNMCLTKCPSGRREGSTCIPDKIRIPPPSSINCRSSPYGNYLRWMCQSYGDVEGLLTDPSRTNMYADDNDQVCTTESPTTMMYFCETAAELRGGAGITDNIKSVYGNTCSQIIKNYMDLSNNLMNLQLLQSGVNDGTTGLNAANESLRKVYANQGCTPTSTTPLCKGLQKGIDDIDGNATDISSMKSQLSGYVQQAVTERQKLLASIRDFQCQL